MCPELVRFAEVGEGDAVSEGYAWEGVCWGYLGEEMGKLVLVYGRAWV